MKGKEVLDKEKSATRARQTLILLLTVVAATAVYAYPRQVTQANPLFDRNWSTYASPLGAFWFGRMPIHAAFPRARGSIGALWNSCFRRPSHYLCNAATTLPIIDPHKASFFFFSVCKSVKVFDFCRAAEKKKFKNITIAGGVSQSYAAAYTAGR